MSVSIDMALGDILEPLFSYSLAHRIGRSDSFYIHPLVHQWARERLSPQEALRKARDATVLLGNVVRVEERASDQWTYEMRIMPHLEAGRSNTEKYLELEKGSPNIFLWVNAMASLVTTYRDQGRWEAGTSSARGEEEGPGNRTPRHSVIHGQSYCDVRETRTVGRGRKAGTDSAGGEQEVTGHRTPGYSDRNEKPSFYVQKPEQGQRRRVFGSGALKSRVTATIHETLIKINAKLFSGEASGSEVSGSADIRYRSRCSRV